MTRSWLSELIDLLGADVVIGDRERVAEYRSDRWPLALKRAAIDEPIGRPEAVVVPRDAAEVAALLAFATRTGVPVTTWGLGSSVTGAPLAVCGGIVCDLSDLAGLVDLSYEDLWVRVRAGTRGNELESELNRAGLTLGHSPQSLSSSTVGGWVATRATGQFSSYYGGIENLVLALEVVLATGEVIRTPLGLRSSLGPDLAGLFIGSEGILGVVTEVTLRVAPLQPHRILEAFEFPDVGRLLRAMRGVAQSGIRPFLVRGYDREESEHLAEGAIQGCLMLLGCAGEPSFSRAALSECSTIVLSHRAVPLGPALVDHWIQRRFDFSAVEAVLDRPGGYAETIEVSSFWSRTETLHAAMTNALKEGGCRVWGHFSHIYPQGTSLYLIVTGQEKSDREAVSKLEWIWTKAMEVCVEQGGIIAHHHGIGLARQPWLADALGDAHGVLQSIKAALDPAGIANPRKLL